MTVNIIDDFTHYPAGGMPPQMRDAMMFDVESGAYFPTVFMNDFWCGSIWSFDQTAKCSIWSSAQTKTCLVRSPDQTYMYSVWSPGQT